MISDVTRDLAAGEDLPYENDCVMIFRTGHGGVTVKFDSGVSRAEGARILARLAAALARDDTAERETAETVPEQQDFNFGVVDPDSVTEDLVRWRDGYAAYKLEGGGWWWVKWRDDTGERWGLSGPLMGSVEVRKGPFDSFDDTLATLTLFRSEGAAPEPLQG